jgi:hypothetical protein
VLLTRVLCESSSEEKIMTRDQRIVLRLKVHKKIMQELAARLGVEMVNASHLAYQQVQSMTVAQLKRELE